MLLDTCALLWLAHKQENLSKAVLNQIDEATIVYISAISGFEISLKNKLGKLILPINPFAWLQNIVEHHNLSIIDLDINICMKATELPLIHKDPCDRFIIATALLNHLPIITKDERFRDYGVKILF